MMGHAIRYEQRRHRGSQTEMLRLVDTSRSKLKDLVGPEIAQQPLVRERSIFS
jgi:hypothetical protein